MCADTDFASWDELPSQTT